MQFIHAIWITSECISVCMSTGINNDREWTPSKCWQRFSLGHRCSLFRKKVYYFYNKKNKAFSKNIRHFHPLSSLFLTTYHIRITSKKCTFAIVGTIPPRKIKACRRNYHARMDSRLFNISCNTRNKCISVFKVSVEIWLKGREKPSCGGQHYRQCTPLPPSTNLVEQWGWWGLNAGLLVRQRQLFQEVHIGQCILQCHLGRHLGLKQNTKPPVLWGRVEILWQSFQGGESRRPLAWPLSWGWWGWLRWSWPTPSVWHLS